MTLIPVEAIRRHLRIDENDVALDEELEQLLDAAVDYVSNYLGRPVPWSTETESEVFPPSVRAAILLVIGDLFENREGATAGVAIQENPSLHRLLHFYRVGLGV